MELPFQTYLDVAFCYSAADRVLRGLVHETRSGQQVAAGEVVLPADGFKPSNDALTLGGSAEHDTNMPLTRDIQALSPY